MSNAEIAIKFTAASLLTFRTFGETTLYRSALYAVQEGGMSASEAAAGMADAATGGPWFSVVKMATETVVGACILLTVILFLRRDRERDKETALRDRERDRTLRSITDGFREEVRTIVGRMESDQDNLVTLNREVVTAVTSLNHTVQQLNTTVAVLGERQTKLEHHVFFPPHSVTNDERKRILELPETPEDEGSQAR